MATVYQTMQSDGFTHYTDQVLRKDEYLSHHFINIQKNGEIESIEHNPLKRKIVTSLNKEKRKKP